MSFLDINAALFRRLGHSFQTIALAEQAFTHRSYGACHNERLEFLGDSIVNFVIAEALFERFPTTREGELTRMRATLIRTETLAAIARELELGDAIRLGSGEMKSGGKRRESILADTLEALIGAIYLDAGADVCRQRVLAWFDQRLQQIAPGESHKDPKTRLQEWLQARKRDLPVYTLAATHGEEHNQQFDVICSIPSVPQQFTGSGSSRRAAEQMAAQNAVEFLERQP
ncbi:MAG TPA: ribonuclease III [Spongiibacteraceae bacterium]|nr:ribonuclease III [Spongiibacteraceae bacterium]